MEWEHIGESPRPSSRVREGLLEEETSKLRPKRGLGLARPEVELKREWDREKHGQTH